LFVTTASFNYPNPGEHSGVYMKPSGSFIFTPVTPQSDHAYVARKIIVDDNQNLWLSFWGNAFTEQERLLFSSNNGGTWTPKFNIGASNNIFSIAVNTNNNHVFIGSRDGVRLSTDGGSNFSQVNNGIPANSWVRDIKIDSAGTIAAATTNGVFISTNNGGLWQQVTGITDTMVFLMFDYDIDGSRNNDSRLLMGSNNGSLAESFSESTYLIATMLAIFDNSEFSGLFVHYLKNENKKVHGASTFPMQGQGGFFISTDNGSNWTPSINGLPMNIKPSAMAGVVNPRYKEENSIKFYLGNFPNTSNGAGVYEMEMEIPASIFELSSNIPGEYKLYQNFPNPFNPVTTIEFTIPNESFVRLEMFNTLGEKVSTLLSQTVSPGSYKYTWNAAEAPSGVYYYRLSSENFSETKKLLLMK
jgi:hypothetical protein